jgi:hypothetical protein
VPDASNFKANPVMAVALIGLTPIFPVILVVPVVEIPDFDRITKLPAVPRFTGVNVAAVVEAELKVAIPPNISAITTVTEIGIRNVLFIFIK